MFHILIEFWRGLQRWERPARLALKLGLLAFVPLLLLWLAGPESLRRPALAGLCGLGLGLQMVFLWAWRGMLSDWTRAQRLYLDGDFEATCELLQARRAAGSADMRSLTLLGNALRMRAMLEQSETVLREAQAEAPRHAFPLTGLGRTLLAQGRYMEAADSFEAAIERGAPEVVVLDLGEALYHEGDVKAAVVQLQTGLDATRDPGRQLIATLLLQRAGASAEPHEKLLHEGLPWLEAQARRFGSTDYGRALQSLLPAAKANPKL